MKFTKMHGLGNDYIYVDGFHENVENPSLVAKKLSDRHMGVGSDGLVLILPSDVADFKMRMFNADGSEAEMCGNAIRCVAKYVVDREMTQKKSLTIETLAGIKSLQVFTGKENRVELVTVDMGEPIFNSPDMVLSQEGSALKQEVFAGGTKYELTCVSMGNPHGVHFVSSVDNFPVHEIGSMLEINPVFPNRINVEFIEVVDSQNLKMRVWERGAGETMACGTGACAALVAACVNEHTERTVTVHLLGGPLQISWKEDNHVWMTGPAVTVFEGVIDLEAILGGDR